MAGEARPPGTADSGAMNAPHLPPPRDAVAAVSHPDPYPWYAALCEGPPLQFDATLGLWVAGRADVVCRALTHPALRVRPPGAPVPPGLAGTPAGALFGQLVRWNDGAVHAEHKPALQALLSAFDPAAVRAATLRAARLLGRRPLDELCFALPVASLAALLGFGDDALEALVHAARRLAEGLSPASTPAQWAAAGAAALALQDAAGTLRAAVGRSAVFRSNLAGLLVQGCDASAALLGNALAALAHRPDLRAALAADATRLPGFVAEVARHDAPVQNTRRFAAEAVAFEGSRLAPGDGLLLVLAAAQRDPALHPVPDRFDLDRAERRLLCFGHGMHRCPGQSIALAIAATTLEWLLTRAGGGMLTLPAGHRPSANCRIPFFDQETSP